MTLEGWTRTPGRRVSHDLLGDIRYAWRTLHRSPGFSIITILTIALGIGGTTAMFSLADAALLRPLAVRVPRELVFITTPGRTSAPPYPAVERVRAQSESFVGLAAFSPWDHLPLVLDGQAEQVVGQLASANYFDVLGVRAWVGRTFVPRDEDLDPAVAVVSYEYWQRRFGGRSDALGTVVRFGDRAVTIIGVTPPGFSGLYVGYPVDMTMPINVVGRERLADAQARWFNVIARLRPTVAPERARAEVDRIYQSYLGDVQASASERGPSQRIQLPPASHGTGRLRADLSRPIVLLMALVGAVLAIACANIANLLLARGSARRRELAIRAAIGAGRLRLIRQLLAETLVLFGLGAAVGALLAVGIAKLMAGFLAIGRLPILLDIEIDARALTVAAVLCVVTALVSGLMPAIRASRDARPGNAALSTALRTGARSSLPLSRSLVAAQVAGSIVILVGGTLVVRTLRELRTVDRGFRHESVVTLSVQATASNADAIWGDRLWTDILDRVRRLPRVQNASLSVLTPLSGRDRSNPVDVSGFQPQSAADRDVRINYVSAGYFDTFGTPVRLGRIFTTSDGATAPRVAIINETAAQFYFAGRNPVGARITFDSAGTRLSYEVVGVVRDAKHKSLREPAPRFVFLPLAQALDTPNRLTLSVRAEGDPMSVVDPIRREVQTLEGEILVSDVLTMERQVDQALLRERLVATLATIFAALGLLLAALGLYGVASYAVVRRRNEIGIRMALGATPLAIQRLMLRDALGMVALGVGIGLPTSLIAAQAIRGLLYGVSPNDPATIGASIGVLLTVAGLAAFLPARRASRIDPALTLVAE